MKANTLYPKTTADLVPLLYEALDFCVLWALLVLGEKADFFHEVCDKWMTQNQYKPPYLQVLEQFDKEVSHCIAYCLLSLKSTPFPQELAYLQYDGLTLFADQRHHIFPSAQRFEY